MEKDGPNDFSFVDDTDTKKEIQNNLIEIIKFSCLLDARLNYILTLTTLKKINR